MKNVLITIDFDFFVPENPDWDISHSESPLYLDIIWAARGYLIDQMKTSGEEKKFPIKTFNNIERLFISESHASVYPLLHNYKTVYLVDTHHDVWHPSNKQLSSGSVDCGNWAWWWLSMDPSHKLIWIRPKHSYFELPKVGRLLSQIKIKHYQPSMTFPHITDIHICRSGCWTPPWLDMDFIRFVRSFNVQNPINLEKDEVWNPMKKRWKRKEYLAAKEAQYKTAEFMKSFKE